MDKEFMDEQFMREALAEAALAEQAGDVPVGAVVVVGGVIVARGQNVRERKSDPTGHAELVAVREAARQRQSWRLLDATVYVTLEPCPMCAGMLVNARIARLVYGCPDPKAGAIDSVLQLASHPQLNHRFEVQAGVMGEQAAEQLRSFFAKKRARPA